MSAQNSKGIQTLLDAEREAQKIVQKGILWFGQVVSRNYFLTIPKPENDARNEAQKEVEEYRKQKDEEFKKFEKEHTSGNKKAEEEANQDAEEKLKEIKNAGSKTGDQVIEELMRVVTDVKPEVPDRIAVPQNA
ncbi:hypothetical protein MMC29_003783 [Sticta canariensis]|nr:hypothetical protein [Sticta canariensis]